MDLGKLVGGLNAKDIDKVITLITENKDVLASVERLPKLFDSFGEGLEAAGGRAREAGAVLVGDGANGVKGTLGDVATSLGGISAAISKGVDRLADVAEGLGRVPMADGPAKSIASAAKEIGGAGSALDDLSGSLETIAELLAKVGAALEQLGDKLDESGTQVKTFMG
ncbi:hypothetical protein ACFU7D_08230 [Nocardioides sp. NPDC057577]|uniref:hypothetical protein n=1 Tax=Nocardioides sp. NPDC057577 TaxID=3346171 RepID=UPI003670D401